MVRKKRSIQEKLVEPQQLEEKIKQLKEQNLTIATLNGSFDLMHAGHLYMIEEAAKQADILLVALNSDSSIQSYKGADRPIINLENRLKMMGSIEAVDFVTWFEEADPRRILSLIKPDVHVNGEEYGPDCIEAEVLKTFGGRLHLVPRIQGLATTSIIEKITKCV